MAAIGGAVWAVNEESQLALQYQINFQETRLGDNEEAQAQHARLLFKTMSSTEGMLAPPHSGAGEDEGANPTDFLLVLAPLRTDLEVLGVVEVLQRSDTGPAIQRGYLRFLLDMCELASDFLKSRQLRHFSDRQVLWSRLEDFARAVHASLEPLETAYTIANEGRRLIECDRVSVAIRKGGKCVIEAVSGQDVFDKRSNTVRLLGRLASAVVASGEAIWYTGDTRDMAPQVEDAVQEYVDESHSKTVAVLPLRRPPRDEEDDPENRQEPPPPVGALIVEQIEDSRPAPALVQRVEVVCRHSSIAHGQCDGAPGPVPHAGLADAGQGPLDRRGPDAAQDAHHRRGRAGAGGGDVPLAGRLQRAIEGDPRTGRSPRRVRRHRRRGRRSESASRRRGRGATNCWSNSATPTPNRR